MKLVSMRVLSIAAVVLSFLTAAIAAQPAPAGASAASAGAGAVSAASGPYRMRIPANFVAVSHVSDDRCYWGVGIEFPKVPKATGYSVEYWDGYWGGLESGTVGVPVSHTGGMTKGMNYFGVTGGGGPAPCGPPDATQGGRFNKGAKAWVTFAHKPKNGFIEGTITDRDDSGATKHKKADSPVEGVEIKAYDGHRHHTAESGPGGIYFITVKPGRYRLVPDDKSVKKSTFKPTYAAVRVEKNTKATADFEMKAGLKVVLDISSSSVAADGMHIVHARLTTRKYGKPAPNETVQLTVDPNDENSALTTAPKVAMCDATGRKWPTGSMSDTLNVPLSVTTGPGGVENLTLAVGTVPGRWSLEAWGKNEDGDLSSDTANASDTKTLDVKALTPTTRLADFTTELKAARAQANFTSADPAYLSSTLSGIAAGSSPGVQLGGLVFSVANSSHGTVLLVSSATEAPRIATDGSVRGTGATAGDLVIDPAEWNPVQNGGLTLVQALQGGEINSMPTLNQWENGTAVTGWSTTSGMTMTVPNQNSLQQFGWSYGPTCS